MAKKTSQRAQQAPQNNNERPGRYLVTGPEAFPAIYCFAKSESEAREKWAKRCGGKAASAKASRITPKIPGRTGQPAGPKSPTAPAAE